MTKVAQEKERKDPQRRKEPSPEARKLKKTHVNTSTLSGRGKTTLERWLQTQARRTEGTSQPSKEPDKDTDQERYMHQETEERGKK